MFYIKLKGVLLVLFLMLQFFGIQGRSLAELLGDGGIQVLVVRDGQGGASLRCPIDDKNSKSLLAKTSVNVQAS